jgi:hypothetical protein
MRFLPTWPTRQEGLILHTHGEGNKWGRVGDGGVVQMTLGGGDWLLWWSSSDKNRTNRLPMFPSCSYVLQFLWGATNWTHMARKPWQLGFGVIGKIQRVWAAIFRGSRCRKSQTQTDSAELPCSSYSEGSRQARMSSDPQNLASLSTLLELNLEALWRLNSHFLPGGVGGVFIAG